MDYTDRLLLLARNDVALEDMTGHGGVESAELSPKTIELVRLAALVAVGGALPSFAAQADAAVSAGATASEIVDVLVGILPVVGVPCVVAAAPTVALALGYDTDEALER